MVLILDIDQNTDVETQLEYLRVLYAMLRKELVDKGELPPRAVYVHDYPAATNRERSEYWVAACEDAPERRPV